MEGGAGVFLHFYFRYGGKTGMAVLAPFGFKETASNDWVSVMV